MEGHYEMLIDNLRNMFQNMYSMIRGRDTEGVHELKVILCENAHGRIGGTGSHE